MRADISRLPFVSGSIDALHAGAAILCWPSPACAVSFLLDFCLFVDVAGILMDIQTYICKILVSFSVSHLCRDQRAFAP